MTPKKLVELLEYIMENNSWQNLYKSAKKKRRCFKYIDFSFDTRDGYIWQIRFREDAMFNMKEDKVFRIESDEDIEAVYAYLDEVGK